MATARLDDLREQVATACRIIGMLEMSNPTQGHVSARVPGEERCLIRARGPGETGLRYTSADEVMLVDFDGRLVEGGDGLAVPIEVFIHTALYRSRPDVNSVIHIHPATVVLFTICDTPLLPLFGSFSPSALELATENRISRYDRSILIRDRGLGDELARAMGETSLCLMRGHGITSVGRDVPEATIAAIHLGELAEMNYRARLLGTPRPISDDDLAFFAEMRQAARARGGAGRPGAGVYSLWRYYVRRLAELGL
jgi:3,4-dihydroxyphthalate decarboxylase